MSIVPTAESWGSVQPRQGFFGRAELLVVDHRQRDAVADRPGPLRRRGGALSRRRRRPDRRRRIGFVVAGDHESSGDQDQHCCGGRKTRHETEPPAPFLLGLLDRAVQVAVHRDVRDDLVEGLVQAAHDSTPSKEATAPGASSRSRRSAARVCDFTVFGLTPSAAAACDSVRSS